MTKLATIAEGWMNLALGRHRDLMLQRLETCDPCEFKTQLSPIGTVIVSAVNHESSIFYCSHCGCPLASKTSVPSERCPQGKWPAVEDEDEESYY